MNEEEDQQRPFLKGHIQIMTIHQAKGLEFPVVLVGRLDKLPPLSSKDERFLLQPYFQRRPFEPENQIAGCDRKRLYYVALSRARDLLVLSAIRKPHYNFLQLWQESASWKGTRAQFVSATAYGVEKSIGIAIPSRAEIIHPIGKAIEARVCQLLFLPSYSPDFSPIEEAFSKLKAFLRRRGVRTPETLQEVIGQASLTIIPLDALDGFTHCGYYPLNNL